ncbi:MAG: EamA family transporter RarD [Candidatus Nanopelagicales bacterium]
MNDNREKETFRTGLYYGLGAYITWGLIPIYWPLLQPASSLEILSHRVVWSLLTLFIIISFLKQWTAVFDVVKIKKTAWILLLASIFISINWGVFIWAVSHDRVVDTALGYFMNPLVSVALGLIIFKEKLRKFQWVAVIIAFFAVLYLTFAAGSFPWISLSLAFSFGFYGLVKKVANVPSLSSLTVETTFVAPFFIGFLIWLYSRGELSFVQDGISHALWLASSGLATIIPLLFFGAAVIRLPLSVTGLLQYIAPILQFLVGLFIFNEIVSPTKWIGFVGIWIALSFFSVDAWHYSRK